MPRAIWKGHISFGLVEIPVSLVPATSSKNLSFHMLDRRTMSPIGNERINKSTGEPVESTDIVKAYELEKGSWVVVTDEDFRQANPEATRTVDIVAFVEAAEIDLRYFDKPYYLEPQRKASKGYALLRETLRRTGKVGLARVVLRTRQYMAAVSAVGPVLLLELLRFHDEVRGWEELSLPEEDMGALGIRENEVRMAESLVAGMTEPWNPATWRDEYREDLLRRIEEKAAAGQATAITPAGEAPEEEEPGVVDLMPLLKASVDRAREREAGTEDEPDRRAGK